MIKRFRLNTHKSILDLGIDFNNLKKDVFCDFRDFKAKAPHPYGLLSTALYVSEQKEFVYPERKEAFIRSVKNCWVRSAEEYPDRYRITFW